MWWKWWWCGERREETSYLGLLGVDLVPVGSSGQNVMRGSLTVARLGQLVKTDGSEHKDGYQRKYGQFRACESGFGDGRSVVVCGDFGVVFGGFAEEASGAECAVDV